MFAVFVYCREISSKNANTSGTVLIVLSPHFDDGILSVGGIISDFRGPKYIVTFFSTPTTTLQYLTPWDKMSGFDESYDARDARLEENDLAAQIVGTKVIDENYTDRQYGERTASTSFLIQNDIAKDVEQIINSMGSTSVIVLGPSYFGDKVTHPDHLLVSKALALIVRNKKYQNVHFYFYEDLPYVYKRFTNGKIELDKVLTNFYPGLKIKKKEVYISQKSFNLKILGIKSYTSQMKAFRFLKENLVENIINFDRKRCSKVLISNPCEVIYEAK